VLSSLHRPIVLPHLERTPNGVLFLGAPAGDEVVHALTLLDRCDGVVTMEQFTDAERRAVQSAYDAGILLAGPPSIDRAPLWGRSVLVVSPHPDDAVLALGGLLASRRASIVDVFSVERWTRRSYYAVRPQLAAALLVAEEELVCQLLDVPLTLLGFVDAADRGSAPGTFLASRSSTAADAGPLSDVTERLRPLVAGEALVLAPLGVGEHLDHLLCREAVWRLLSEGAVDLDRLAFYADQPYSMFASAAVVAEQLSNRLEAEFGRRLMPSLLELTPRSIEVKAEAARAYRLQVLESVIRRITAYDARQGPAGSAAERLWRPAERVHGA
jgi:LmbE family N-acetylglucosaminyl deacetylase